MGVKARLVRWCLMIKGVHRPTCTRWSFLPSISSTSNGNDHWFTRSTTQHGRTWLYRLCHKRSRLMIAYQACLGDMQSKSCSGQHQYVSLTGSQSKHTHAPGRLSLPRDFARLSRLKVAITWRVSTHIRPLPKLASPFAASSATNLEFTLYTIPFSSP